MSFKEIIEEVDALHAAKQRDYGRVDDGYANIRGSADYGIEPWLGAEIRLNDKNRRIQKFAKERKLANESVEDSMMDRIVYAIIVLDLYRKSRNKEADPTPPSPLSGGITSFPTPYAGTVWPPGWKPDDKSTVTTPLYQPEDR